MRIGFWKDKWCGEVASRVSFPSLFVLATNKDAFVAYVWDDFGEVGGWFPYLTRPLNDWELDDLESFLHTF